MLILLPLTHSSLYNARLHRQPVSYPIKITPYPARVVKLVDTRDLKSLDCNGHTGSIPVPGTKQFQSVSM